MNLNPSDPEQAFIISKCNFETLRICIQCKIIRRVEYTFSKNNVNYYICYENCLEHFMRENTNIYLTWLQGFYAKLPSSYEAVALPFVRLCCACNMIINTRNFITWQCMEFCNEMCLLKRQVELGSNCVECYSRVPIYALGKYCVRFASDIRQFCSIACLKIQMDSFEMCFYCLQDLHYKSKETVGYQQFCNHKCMEKCLQEIQRYTIKICKSCKGLCEGQFKFDGFEFEPCYFCSPICFYVFCSSYTIEVGICYFCFKYVPAKYMKRVFFFNSDEKHFCSNICLEFFINCYSKRTLVCNWCKIVKYNYEFIKRNDLEILVYCSINCYIQRHMRRY